MQNNRENGQMSIADVLIYLVSCAINKVVPKCEIYSKVNLGDLLIVAKEHSVVSMVAKALEDAGFEKVPEKIAAEYKIERNKVIRKNLLLDAERSAMFKFFENEHIKYLPLKGIVMQRMYPGLGLRQMADNDILYDDSFKSVLKKYMLSRGFCFESEGGVHDCYLKEPVYNFEMHSKLFYDWLNNGRMADYYSHVWEMAVRDKEDGYGYHFKDEDFYVYNIAHANKHYSESGTGIRTLADIYVMNHAFKNIDRDYVNNELKKLGLSDFEVNLRKLSKKLLSDSEKTFEEIRSLDEDAYSKLGFMLLAGTYGNVDNKVKKRMKETAGLKGKLSFGKKLRYCFKRIFPGQKELIKWFPLAKYKVMIPFIWIFRLLRGATFRRKRVAGEIKAVKKVKEI